MKKKATSTNRAGNNPSTANANLVVLTDAALSWVKGGGSPQPPDLDPTPIGGGGGDPPPPS